MDCLAPRSFSNFGADQENYLFIKKDNDEKAIGCQPPSDPRYTYLPNPAPYYLNVSVASAYLGSTYIKAIQLVSVSTGATVYNQDYSYGNVTNTTIVTSSYPAGNYTLRIFDGTAWSTNTIIR